MTQFEFATAGRIIFGSGMLGQAGSLAARWGKRALVTCGLYEARARPLLDSLEQAGVLASLYPVEGEPTVETIQRGVEQARREGCQLVIGFGGGSALDTGKAIAALATNPGELMDYLEVVGRGQPITQEPLPLIAIPTTAGTGSEVTRNAVIGVPDQRVKVSLRSPMMLPRIALVDPQLTYDLPPEITASTGLDALTQLIEPFVSNQANPLVDAICREGMRRAARSLQRAYEQGGATGRAEMSLASLFGGLALANAKLGSVHGFAGVLGGMFPAPHGAICARLLPYTVAVNLRAIQERAPDGEALQRYREVARILTGDANASIEEGLTWLQELCSALNVPPLRAYGLAQADFEDVIEKSAHSSSMKGNPIQLTRDEMEEILTLAIDNPPATRH